MATLELDENRKALLLKVLSEWGGGGQTFGTPDEETAFWQTFTGIWLDLGGDPKAVSND